MKLEVNGIEVECVIGEMPEERVKTQRLRVDLQIEIPEAVAETDAIEDTVDYVEIADDVRKALIAAKCRMIERAAKIAAETAARDPRIGFVSARVEKSGAVPGIGSAAAIYTVG